MNRVHEAASAAEAKSGEARPDDRVPGNPHISPTQPDSGETGTAVEIPRSAVLLEARSMVRFAFYSWLLFASSMPLVQAQSPYELEAFGRDEPRTIFFRRETLVFSTDVPQWRAAVTPFAGVVNKGVHEELCQPHLDENLMRCRDLNALDERELAVLHYNINARETECDGNLQIGEYFAGHWLYLPGCGLSANINATQQTIPVQDTSRFRMDVGLVPGFNDDIVIVPKVGGVPQWELAEQVTLLSIDPGLDPGQVLGGGGSITVLRGQYGTTPRAFNASTAWVAPHAHEGPWGGATYNRLLWEYNFDPSCPQDSGGRQAKDVLHQELSEILINDPATNFYDGIEFDISRFDKSGWYAGRRIDIDFDGQADHDDLAKQRTYGRGVLTFYSELRDILGPDRLILADGGMEDSQRAFGILNGMESEGFPDLWDVEGTTIELNRWSNLINRLEFWNENGYQPNLNYVVIKNFLSQGTSITPPDNIVRLAAATAVCTDSAFAYLVNPGTGFGVWDEVDKGNGEFGWLGEPRGPTRRLGLEVPDELFGLGAPEAGFRNRWRSSDASITQQDGEFLKIDPYAGRDPAFATLTSYVRLGGNTEILVSMDVRGDGMAEFNGFEVPRTLKCRHLNAAGEMHSAAGSLQGDGGAVSVGLGIQTPEVVRTPEDGVSALVGEETRTVTFLLRDLPSKTFRLELEFEIEGDEALYISNLRLHAGADWMAREFDHGAVLANPSDRRKTYDLEALFPGRSYEYLSHRSEQANEPTGAAPGQLTLDPHTGLFLVDVSAPTARFEAGSSYGTSALAVDFQDKSRGDITQFDWDFGDGSSSNEASPTHLFGPGVYDVSLTVSGPTGTDTHTERALVVVDPNLISQTDTHVQSFGDPDWKHDEWDGKGFVPMGLHSSGAYFAGAEDWSRIYPDYMLADGSESALRWTLPGNLGQAPVGVSVDLPGIRKRNVNGGDGTLFSLWRDTQRVVEPRHLVWDDWQGFDLSYGTRLFAGQSIGMHLAERNAFFHDGTYVEPSITTWRAPTSGAPVANFSADGSIGSAPFGVQFTDRSLYGVQQWAWDFDDDGQTDSTARNPYFTYNAPGVYGVRLVVNGGADEFYWPAMIRARASWRATQGFPTSAPGSNTYGAGWSAWEWRPGLGYSPMNAWNAAAGCFQGAQTWSRVYLNYQSAHGAHSVRAWQAPSDGLYEIAGDIENGQTTCGDGVKVAIRHNGRRIWGPIIMEANESSSMEHRFLLSMQQGDLIQFHVDPRTSAGCDDAVWIPTVTRMD